MAASSARSQATMAGIGGALDMGKTVLGGISQYGSLRALLGGNTFNATAALKGVGAGMTFKPISMNFG